MALTTIDDRGLKTPIDLLDNEKIRFGTGNDLEVFHNGTDSFVKSTTGQLCLNSDEFGVANAAYTENIIRGTANSDVELYYDGVKQINTTSTGVTLNDNKRIDFGTGADLRIYHESSSTTNWLEATNGDTKIQCTDGDIYLNPKAGEVGVKVITDGAVELYHNNAKHFYTTAAGAVVTRVSGGQTELDVVGCEGNDATIRFKPDDGDDNADYWRLKGADAGGFFLENYTDGAWETNIKAVGAGAVELYHNNSKKLETWSGGVTATGAVHSNETSGTAFKAPDGGKYVAGTGDDLQIYHDGSNSYITNTTGGLIIRGTGGSDFIHLEPKTDENGILIKPDGATELYYDNVKKLETTSTGVTISNGGVKPFIITAGEAEVVLASTGGGSTKEWRVMGSTGGTTHKFRIYDAVAGADRFNIDSNGNVLIGTNSWSYPKALNVQGSSGSILSLYNADTTTYAADTSSAIELKLLTGNTGNQTGSLEIRGIKENGTNGNNARALTFYTAGNGASNAEGMRISSEGYVTKPKQPSFVARAGANRDNETGSLTFTSCDSAWNVSSSYDTSNSRFTAPVAGWYHFGGQAGYKETGDNYNVKFMVNGAYQFEVARVIGGSDDDAWITHSGWSWCQLYKLAKDDYVEIETAYEMHQNGTYSHFWGYLIK